MSHYYSLSCCLLLLVACLHFDGPVGLGLMTVLRLEAPLVLVLLLLSTSELLLLLLSHFSLQIVHGVVSVNGV